MEWWGRKGTWRERVIERSLRFKVESLETEKMLP